MTARSAATIASLALLAVVSGCTSFFEVPIETPLSPKMDVSAFRRVLVAGATAALAAALPKIGFSATATLYWP